MRLAYLFSPFIRIGNLIKRSFFRYFSHFTALKPSNTIFKLGTWNNTIIVQTKYGLVSGFSERGVWCWKGIPYANPPLRWKAPIDQIPWAGIRKTRKFGNSAAQVMPLLGPTGSEDCLYLNI